MSPPPYKVMHVITRLDWGGSAQNTLLTALGHTRARFTPSVVTGQAGVWTAQGGDAAVSANVTRLEKADIPCRVLPSLKRSISPIHDLAACRALAALFRSERPDIVHTHTSKAGLLGRLAARQAKVPVIVHTPHGHVFYGHFGRLLSTFLLSIERQLATRTDRLIALTEAERDDHLIRGVGRADRFAVVASGVDLDRFRAAARRPEGRHERPPGFDCPPDAVVVGSVGWLTPVKGHHVLVEALGKLQRSHPELHGVIVGSGERLHELQALAGRVGIGKKMRWLGRRDDIPACLAGMDIFVLPSLNEGMGRALVEAMAAGRPVIATRVGGVPALIDHGRTGLLIPPADADALATAIADLLHHPERMQAMASAAQAGIGRQYGIDAMVSGVEAVYESALQETGQ
jgi:glycosyltransferase involved in cell wall biosynthesis